MHNTCKLYKVTLSFIIFQKMLNNDKICHADTIKGKSEKFN